LSRRTRHNGSCLTDSKDDAVQREKPHCCCRDTGDEEISIDLHASCASPLDLPAKQSRADVSVGTGVGPRVRRVAWTAPRPASDPRLIGVEASSSAWGEKRLARSGSVASPLCLTPILPVDDDTDFHGGTRRRPGDQGRRVPPTKSSVMSSSSRPHPALEPDRTGDGMTVVVGRASLQPDAKSRTVTSSLALRHSRLA
jgi:hypothetical protein